MRCVARQLNDLLAHPFLQPHLSVFHSLAYQRLEQCDVQALLLVDRRLLTRARSRFCDCAVGCQVDCQIATAHESTRSSTYRASWRAEQAVVVCVVEAVEYLGLNGVKVSELVEGLVGEVVESSQGQQELCVRWVLVGQTE